MNKWRMIAWQKGWYYLMTILGKLKTSYNYGKWSDANYDNLVRKAGNQDANDPATRWNDLVSAAKIVNKNQAITPIYLMPQFTCVINSRNQIISLDCFNIKYQFGFLQLDILISRIKHTIPKFLRF